MRRRQPKSTRTDTRLPYTTLVRSLGRRLRLAQDRGEDQRAAPIRHRNRRARHPVRAHPFTARRRHAAAHDPRVARLDHRASERSEEHTSELQSLMRISYAVFSLKTNTTSIHIQTMQYEHSTP